MLSVLLRKKEGFAFYFVLQDDAGSYGGGLTQEGRLVCEQECPQKELMLRTLINKCKNDFVKEVFSEDIWGLPLERFGFTEENGLYRSSWEALRLPHDCKEAP